MSDLHLVFFALALCACGSGRGALVIGDEPKAEASGDSGGEDSDEGESSDGDGNGDGDGDGDPLTGWTPTEIPCECEDGQSCVVFDPSGCKWWDEYEPSLSCVDTPPACADGTWTCDLGDPCVAELCGIWRGCSPYADITGDGCEDAYGEDVVCEYLDYCRPHDDACPNGQKCVPYSWSTHTWAVWDTGRCMDVVGNDPPGSSCTRDLPVIPDSCDASSACWTANITSLPTTGTCREFCGGTVDAPTCPDGFECLITEEGALALCVEPCDPLAPSCAEGQGCSWVGSIFTCIDSSSVDIPVGQACGKFVNDCTPGSLCVAAEGLDSCMGWACCSPYCDTQDPNACADPLSCQPLFQDGGGSPAIGACALDSWVPEAPDAIHTGLVP